MEDAAGPGAGDVRSERAAGGHSSTVGPVKAGLCGGIAGRGE